MDVIDICQYHGDRPPASDNQRHCLTSTGPARSTRMVGDRDAAFRELIERSPDAVIIGREGRVLHANAAAARILGYERPEELVGTASDDLAGGLIRCADGSLVALAGSLVTIDFGGAPAAAFIGRDDRDIHDLALGALVAGIAHQVRNPLFAISATLDAFEATAPRGPPPERMMQALRSELDRLNRLVSDLVDYGRPAATAMVEEPLGPVLSGAANSCRPAAEKASVQIEADSGAGCVLRMQPSRLQLVFENLLRNAVQHARPGQAVCL